MKSYLTSLITVLVLAGCSTSPGEKNRLETNIDKPNIIFILTDDQRFDALGYSGNEIIVTPQMDQLAKEGTYFKYGLVTTPICSASRASIFSGLHERTHNYSFSSVQMKPEHSEKSYPRLLKDAGYYTGFYGKVGVRISGIESYFDRFENLTLREGYYSRQLRGKDVHLTRYTGQMALDFIEQAPRDKPFALSLSFNAPHAKDTAKEQYFWQAGPDKLYRDRDIPPAVNATDQHFNDLPDAVKEGFNRTRYGWRFDTPEKYQHSVKGYYRMISGIDDEIGKIRVKLEQTGQDKNTVIILMGDNGYFLGERQIAGKWLLYENSIRVPLIIFDPREPGHREINDMALNIDIPSTILELAGVDVPDGYQGESLLPLVTGETESLSREAVLIEHLWDFKQIPRSEGVRTANWKYLRYVDDPSIEELYDLQRDPGEVNNLVASPAHQETLHQMQATLEELISRYSE